MKFNLFSKSFKAVLCALTRGHDCKRTKAPGPFRRASAIRPHASEFCNNHSSEFRNKSRLRSAILLVLFKQSEHLIGFHGSPDQISLDFVAIGPAQVVELLRAFDAFCDDADPEILSQCNDGFHDCSAIRLHQHVTNKRLVDFNATERKSTQLS